MQNIFTLHTPDTPLPVVFDSPHSGRAYPADFGYACPPDSLERIIDRHIDDLFSGAPDHGAYLLCADFARTYIDLNRARDDIDPTLINGKWPSELYGGIKPTSRSDSGIGLIPRIAKPGTPIYNRKLGAQEVMNRITTHYDPYHKALEDVLENANYNFGGFWHINCHSMPTSSAWPRRNISMAGIPPKAIDIVLGDLDGRTCGREFLYAIRDFWKSRGLRVSINDPFRGVELIRRHAAPLRGRHSLQIEINRSLYMNEETGEKKADYEAFKSQVTDMIAHACTFARKHLNRMAAD